MSADVFMPEVFKLAAAVPRNRCPATDALEFLDANPGIRLTLEDTWTSPFGQVYREVPADRVSRWPAHIARTFRSFLRISKEPAQVLKLLDLFKELNTGPEVVQATLAGCKRRSSLEPAIEYFTNLVEELNQVTYIPPKDLVLLGTNEPSCRPRMECGEAKVGTWVVADSAMRNNADPNVPPSHRPVLLHDPTSVDNSEADWINQQPRAYRRFYHEIKHAKPIALTGLKQRLLEASTASWGHSQMQVLWSAYHMRRNYLRKVQEQRARCSMRPTARKLLRRISKIRSKSELGYVGKSLYEAMKGNIQLPGPVSQPEWAVVFESYRNRKTEMLSSPR